MLSQIKRETNMRVNILIIYLFLLPMFSFANDNIVKISFSEFPPFEFMKDGKASGFSVDLLLDIFESAGYKVEFIYFPWKRALEAGKAGETDVIVNVKKSEEREKYFIYSDPILYYERFFFKKKTLDIHPTSFAEISSYDIATVNGYFYGEDFDNAHLHLAPTSSSDPAMSNLRKLVAGRVDLVVCQVNVCNYLIDQHKEEFAGIDYIASLPISAFEPTYIAFPRAYLARSQQLLQVFNAGLKKYIAEGKKAELITKYSLEGVK